MRTSILIFSAILLFVNSGMPLLSMDRIQKNFRVAFVGDPQVNDSMELDYARKSVYRELRERGDIDLVIFLGDIVNDSMDLMEPSRTSMDSLPCPWATVPGNHDFDIYSGKKAVSKQPGRTRDLVTYRKIFGSPDTTFTADGIRFILMNDLQYEENSYRGGFMACQTEFMDSVITCSDGQRMLVLATHIPYSEIKDRDVTDSLLSLFKGDILLVGGHTHTVRREDLDLPGAGQVHQLTAGATCGSWWRGKADRYGVPYALQNCGSPRGYFIADFRRNGYTLSYKCIGRDKSDVVSVRSEDVQDDSVKLTANIFGGAVEGKVEIKSRGLADGRWLDMELNGELAPEVLDVISERDSMSREERREKKNEIIPLRRLASPHVWSVSVPENSAGLAGIKKVKIRYEDRHMKFRKTASIQQEPTGQTSRRP